MIDWFINLFVRHHCAHAEYRENLACNCICTSCGENLGFIGSIKENYPDAKNVGYGRDVHVAQGWTPDH